MNITSIKHVCHENLLYVKLETDEGIVGIGEATLRGKIPAVMEAINLLAAHVVGTTVFSIEDMFHKYFYQDRWRNGPIMNTAISGVEMAMWDTIGKKLGVPVYNLLGGKVREKVQLYANGWSKDNGGDLSKLAEKARNTLEMGFKALKWDPFPLPELHSPLRHIVTMETVMQGLEQVGAVREAVGPEIEIFIEGHARLYYDQALWFVRNAEQYGIGFFEEPMQPDDWEGFKKLALKSNIPIATGERFFTRWGHKRLYEEGICSIAQPDFTHCGGIWESKKMSAMAEAYYVRIAPHNSSGPVATMVSAHIDITLPNFFKQEFFVKNFAINRDLFNNSLNIEDGYLILDDKPGLGISPDWEKLEKGSYKFDPTTW